MALTDQQYNQILKYSSDEMTPDERKAFETSLLENKELYDELEFYIQLQSLSDSIEKKTGDAPSLIFKVEKGKRTEYREAIANARKDWEEKYENELKLKYGVGDTKSIAVEKKNRFPTSSTLKWLLAATLIGLISLVILLLYSRDNNNDSKVAINNTKKNSVSGSDSVSSDSSKNNFQPLPIPPQGHTSNKDVSQNEKAEAKPGIKTYTLDSSKRERLFATNFVKDTTPADADGRLRKAFAFYNNSDYVNALLAFDKSETLVRRGLDEHKALTKFYTDYYRALSYLSIDSTETAISFLRDSITASPDSSWKGKVEWYLALAYLRTGNITEAKRVLQRISSNQAASEYKSKSSALINELD